MTAAVVRWLLLLLAVAAASAARAAAAAPGCSQETLPVRGVPVTIVYCISATPHYEGDEMVVPISATYSAPGGTFGRLRELRFVGGEGAPRILENVQLARLGMPGVLHLTLVYAAGQVLVEGALLTPGGITIK
jgi:hypothetical protein